MQKRTDETAPDRYLDLLNQRNKTCIVLNHDAIIYESDAFGVKPLRLLRQSGFQKQPGDRLILTDRVIGKGALILAQLLGIDEIHTPLVSDHALTYSKKIGIPICYAQKVSMIENRTRSGMCPIEHSVLHTDDPVLGEQHIEEAIAILMQGPK